MQLVKTSNIYIHNQINIRVSNNYEISSYVQPSIKSSTRHHIFTQTIKQPLDKSKPINSSLDHDIWTYPIVQAGHFFPAKCPIRNSCCHVATDWNIRTGYRTETYMVRKHVKKITFRVNIPCKITHVNFSISYSMLEVK